MPNVDFPEDEVVLALSEDTTALQTYAIGFWKPLPLQKPYQEKFYHIQSGPGGESPLLERLAPTMKNLVNKIIQKADFLQVHSVWKSQKKSHSTLRAKRTTFTFWVDKS